MDNSCLSLLGCEFAGASYVGKIQLIDAAIGRVLVSQSSETGNNRQERAQLDRLIAARKYFLELQQGAVNPSGLSIGWYSRS